MAYDEDLADRIRWATQDADGLTEKRMFGGLAFLVHGHLAVAASGQGGLLLRIDPEQGETLVQEEGVSRAVMGGRTMDGWLRVEDCAITADGELKRWTQLGVDYAGSLPPR